MHDMITHWRYNMREEVMRLMAEIALDTRAPKFPEGTRVMLKPMSAREANAGYETPTGRVVVAGARFYVVLLDPEFRPVTNPDGYIDISEDALEAIDVKLG